MLLLLQGVQKVFCVNINAKKECCFEFCIPHLFEYVLSFWADGNWVPLRAVFVEVSLTELYAVPVTCFYCP